MNTGSQGEYQDPGGTNNATQMIPGILKSKVDENMVKVGGAWKGEREAGGVM